MPWWHSSSHLRPHSVSDSDIHSTPLLSRFPFFSRQRLHLARRPRLPRFHEDRPLPDEKGPRSEPPSSPNYFERASIDSSPSSSASPLPLPLPESTVFFQHDASSNNFVKVTLPSPEEARGKSGATSVKGEYLAAICPTRLVSQNRQQSTVQLETNLYGSSRRESSDREKDGEKKGIRTPNSAPTSRFSSPVVSPRASDVDIFSSYLITRPAFHRQSASELPSADINPGQSNPCHMQYEETAFSVDSSPIQSPGLSPSRYTKGPSRPVSPFLSTTSSKTSLAQHEGRTQANVHPLPLPPGASIQGAALPAPPISTKSEVISVRSQWKKGKLIGRGTFGSVYVASNCETGALCAMKEVEIIKDDTKSAECMRQLEQEINVLSQLKHPNIVQYYGSEIVGDYFYIYLEYVHPGSINRYIRDHCEAITESVVRNFTRHILCGLNYLHSTKTIHRDIKGANLLVDSNGVVKLADFGMAKHLTLQASTLSMKGSPYWMAPELLQTMMQKDVSPDLAFAVDIWSLGCTIIEMLIGKPPWSEFEGAAALFKVLRETPPIPETLSSEGKDFLSCCFCRNPAERSSAGTLLEHPFMKNSQHLDVPTCARSVDAIMLMDTAHIRKEFPFAKPDWFPVLSDAQSMKGSLARNDVRQTHRKAVSLTVTAHHSPRSTLEAISSLSPPHSSCIRENPSPVSNLPTSSKRGSKNNVR